MRLDTLVPYLGDTAVVLSSLFREAQRRPAKELVRPSQAVSTSSVSTCECASENRIGRSKRILSAVHIHLRQEPSSDHSPWRRTFHRITPGGGAPQALGGRSSVMLQSIFWSIAYFCAAYTP